jgi:peptidyl-prolyl cis-trans isomerase C
MHRPVLSLRLPLVPPAFRAGLAGALLSLGLAACGALAPSPAPLPPTATPAPPTATPEPMAALVNGEPISLAAYEEEVARFEQAQASLGIDLASLGTYRQTVLDALIDRKLLAQGALQSGETVDEALVEGRLSDLAVTLGGNEAMGAWLAASGFTVDSLRLALREEILADRMADRLADGVQDTEEQVHARHILVGSQAEAEDILARLQNGEDFAELASYLSLDLSTRPAGGDLGWFPRDYLLVPEVEQAAFTLQPGEISGVVASSLGYHIVESLQREPHPLSDAARRALREQMVKNWLADQRMSTPVEVFVQP